MNRTSRLMVALAYVGLMSATLRAEPQITGVTQYFGGFHVRVSGIEKPTYLMQVYDAVDHGDPLADWPTIRYVCTLAAGQAGATCPLPADWGVSVRAMRFFLIDKENAYIRVVGSGTTGGQYVQTDTTLTGGSRVRMELAVMDDTANGCPFCARTLAGAAKRFAIFTQFATSGNNKKNWRYDYAGKNGDCSGSYKLEEPLTIDFNGPNCTVDGTPLVNDYAGGPAQSFATPGLALFAAYTTQSDNVTSKITGYTAKGNFKVWSTQVWLDGADESSLALDLLPGKTNGRACLVDMKTGRPYYGQETDFAVCFDSPCALSASFTADTTPAVVYDAGSYAQSSHLIAQWDAIENAGRGVHSDAPSTWVDLIGNAQNIRASDALQYQPTAVYFPGGLNGTYSLSCNLPEIKTALANKSCTVEMQLNVVEPTKNTKGEYCAGGILQVGGTDEDGKNVNHRELVIYQRDNRTLTSPHTTKCDTFGSLQYATTSMDSAADMPPENDHYGKDVLMTVVVDGDNAKLYVDCEHLHTSLGKGDVPPLDFFRVGSWGKTMLNGKWTWEPDNGSSKMYVRSIRVYDTSLTPEETQRNLLVDQCRFGMQIANFEYDFEGGTLTLSGNFRTDLGFGYDVYALVLDVNGNGTVSTNLLGTIAQAQSASYSLQGLDPNGRYEVGLLLANAERGYANVVRRVSLPSVAEPEPIAWVGKTSDALPWDSTAGWVANNSGLHRLPMDGDTVSIGREAGDYTLDLTGAGTLAVKGWTGAGCAGVTSKATVGAGTALTVNGEMAFSKDLSGCRSEFVVDGGSVQVDGSNAINLYGNDVLTVKDGAFLKAATAEAVDLIVLNGTSRINVQGGEFTMGAKDVDRTDTIAFTGDQGIVQTGGTMSFSAFSTAAQADSFYEISGGALNIHRFYRGHDISQSRRTSCTTVRPRGSKFDLLVLGGLVSDQAAVFRTLPSLFFDFRVRSDSTPGVKGVGFVDNAGTGVYGVWRIVPDGGLAIVHTNRFPLMVQHDQKTIAIGTMGAQSGAGEQPGGWFMPTGLFDISIPAEQDYMVRADLKPEAELADGWTGAEGVSAGFVKLPRVHNPARLPRANLKLKVEPQGAKTLASIKADLEAMGFGPVTADETAAYNLVVGLPKDRLAHDFPDSKVLIDFTEVMGATAAQQNNVTTNALIKAVSLDIVKPGLVLMVR